jgi:hypothetical protein
VGYYLDMANDHWLRVYVELLGHRANQLEALLDTLREESPELFEKYQSRLKSLKERRAEEAQAEPDKTVLLENQPLGAVLAMFQRESK